MVGCKKCPAFEVCPLKSVIGDYQKRDEPQPGQQTASPPSSEKRDA
jgi:hypothetical protein